MNQTLEYFLENIGRPHGRGAAADGPAVDPHEGLDAERLQGRFVVLIDGSGYGVLAPGIATIA